jgi:hypothetical protein
MMTALETEARLFAAYLGAKHPAEELINRYCKGIELLAITGSHKEMKVLGQLPARSFLLPFIDAGFGLLKPQHVIRKRLLVMAALIETDKAYTHQFITEQDVSMPVLRFVYRGAVAVVKACLGSTLVIVCRWK